MAKIDPNIVILLSTEVKWGFGKIYANTHVQNNGLDTGHPSGAILNPTVGDTYGWQGKYGHLDRLRATAQYDPTNPQSAYGWEVEYSDHMFIRLMEADVMLKTLRKIDRDMRKLTDQFGYASDFGEYIARFASVIGCNKFAVYSREMRSDGTHYRWYDMQGMRWWVAEQHKPANANA